MMKKLLLTAVLIALVLSLAGCGQPKEEAPAVKLPLDELAASVAADAGTLLKLSAEDLEDALGITPEMYTEFIYLQDDAMTGREILALRTGRPEAAEQVRVKLEAYLERQRKETRDYLPEAYKLLSAAKVEVKNNTVALIAGENAAEETRKLLAGE